MCDCENTNKQKLEMRARETLPDAKVKLDGYRLVFARNTNDMIIRPSMPYTVRYTHTFKNGRTTQKKETGTLFFNYCPFCGEKIG